MHPRILPSNGILRDQRNFRSLLQAMSRPGRLFRLEAAEAPGPCRNPGGRRMPAGSRGRIQHVPAAIRPELWPRRLLLPPAPVRPVCPRRISFSSPAPTGNGAARGPGAAASTIPMRGHSGLQPGCPDPRPGHFRIRLSGRGIPEAEGIAPAMREIPVAELQELQAANADYPLGSMPCSCGRTGR
jgi:hypothetical protein